MCKYTRVSVCVCVCVCVQVCRQLCELPNMRVHTHKTICFAVTWLFRCCRSVYLSYRRARAYSAAGLRQGILCCWFAPGHALLLIRCWFVAFSLISRAASFENGLAWFGLVWFGCFAFLLCCVVVLYRNARQC